FLSKGHRLRLGCIPQDAFQEVVHPSTRLRKGLSVTHAVRSVWRRTRCASILVPSCVGSKMRAKAKCEGGKTHLRRRGHLTCTVKSLAWSFRPTIRLRSTHYVAIRAWSEGILKHQDTYDRYEHGSRNYRKRCASYSRHYSIPEIGRLPWCAFGRQ